jgi:plastocyanin
MKLAFPGAGRMTALMVAGVFLPASASFAEGIFAVAANHEVRFVADANGLRPRFEPNESHLQPGDTVTFISRGHTGQHNIVSDTGMFRCALGCDGDGGNGDPTYADFDVTIAFPVAGVYGYHCAVHGDGGTIFVGDPPAAGVAIDAGFTGSWYNPSQSGHGFNIEVLAGGGMLAYWYVFDAAGTPQWIVAQGTIDGDVATLDAFLVLGGLFPPDFDPTAITREAWGQLVFTFSDCNHGQVGWTTTNPAFSDGQLDLVRLSLPAGLACPQR